MWQERLADRPGIKQLVACIDGDVVGHLTIDVQQRPRRSHVADFGICVDSHWKNRGVASALMRETIAGTEPAAHLRRAIIKTLLMGDDPSSVDLYSDVDDITISKEPFNEINNEITQQSLSISANEIFRMAAIAFILLTVLVWFAKPPFTAKGVG